MGGSSSKEEDTRAAVVSRVEDKEGQVTVEVSADDRDIVFNKLLAWGSSPHGRICSNSCTRTQLDLIRLSLMAL